MTDFELYFRARAGDEAAFNTLYHRHATPVFNYIYRLVLDRPLAEDVFQETFIRVIQSNLEERAQFSTWLYRVATNLCYKALRNRKSNHIGLDDNIIAETENPVSAFQRKQTEERITSALAKLPDNQRVVLVLRFFEDKSYQDISHLLSCPLGTVKSRVFYALENLKKIFIKER